VLAVAIVLSALILIALLRFGLYAEYGGGGFVVSVRVGPLKLQIHPVIDRPGRAKAWAVRKGKRVKKKLKQKMDKEEPGHLKDLLEFLPAVGTTLGRLKRRLLIKDLTICYTAAGGADPSRAAIMFGAASAAFGGVLPFLESNFRIKRRDLRASADFSSEEQYIYVHAAISLAVWEALYIASAILPALIRSSARKTKEKSDGKDGKNNGQATDK
jgi:hypothetical protein